MRRPAAIVIFAVGELARSRDFYTQAFGWEISIDSPRYIELAISDSLALGLYERGAYYRNLAVEEPSTEPDVRAAELYLYVEQPEELAGALAGLGARQLSPLALRSWGDEVTYLLDPDGYVLALARR
jgi:catechol 2,3-dioxygenase-like lactoylglutathione lyase family enzyme